MVCIRLLKHQPNDVFMTFVTASAVNCTFISLGNHGNCLIDIIPVDNWSFGNVFVAILRTSRLLQ